MSEHVEGDWKNFVFQLGRSDDAVEVSQHVRQFFLRDELMNVYLGWSENNALDHDKMVQLALSHGISLLLREKDTGELAGVNLVMDTRLPGFDSLFSPQIPKSPHLTKILTFINRLEETTESAFTEHFPSQFHAEIFITSAGTKYRGCGIGTELYIRMMTLLKSCGFPVIRSSFSSPATRAIGRKLGFRELGRLYFKDQLDKEENLLFPTAGEGEEEYANEMAIFLN